MACPLPSKFRIPTLDSFDGSQDPFDHLETFRTLMNIHAYLDEILCGVFPATLKGPARLWYSKIKAGTVANFSQLSRLFVGHFIGGQRQRRPVTHLLTIKQGRDESLRDYVTKFNRELLEIDEADDKLVMTAFMSALRSPRLTVSLVKKPPVDMVELMSRAQKHINVEDAMRARKENDGVGSSRQDKKRPTAPETVRGNQGRKSQKFDSYPDRRPDRTQGGRTFTPLNTRLENVLFEIQNDPALRWPGKMRAPADKRSKTKYCRFHRDHGHDTEDCFDLKRQVEDLIRRGRLGRFVAGREGRQNDRRSPDREGQRRRTPEQRNPDRRDHGN